MITIVNIGKNRILRYYFFSILLFYISLSKNNIITTLIFKKLLKYLKFLNFLLNFYSASKNFNIFLKFLLLSLKFL